MLRERERERERKLEAEKASDREMKQSNNWKTEIEKVRGR